MLVEIVVVVKIASVVQLLGLRGIHSLVSSDFSALLNEVLAFLSHRSLGVVTWVDLQLQHEVPHSIVEHSLASALEAQYSRGFCSWIFSMEVSYIHL